MNRFIALLLFVAAIYVVASVATEGLDHAFGGAFGGSNAGEPAVVAEEAARSEVGDGSDAPSARRPITERVRVQVQGDVDDYSRRVGAE